MASGRDHHQRIMRAQKAIVVVFFLLALVALAFGAAVSNGALGVQSPMSNEQTAEPPVAQFDYSSTEESGEVRVTYERGQPFQRGSVAIVVEKPSTTTTHQWPGDAAAVLESGDETVVTAPPGSTITVLWDDPETARVVQLSTHELPQTG